MYRHTMTELLEGIVNDEDDFQAMLEVSNHVLWSSGRYEGALRDRLGTSYDAFLSTIDEVDDELQELVTKLKLEDGRNSWKVSEDPKTIINRQT